LALVLVGFVGEFWQRLSIRCDSTVGVGANVLMSFGGGRSLAVAAWMRWPLAGATMASNSEVELYATIRRDVRGGMSIRAVNRKYTVGQRTVRKALASLWPEPREQLPRRRSRLDPYLEVIDAWMRVDLDALRKQRHTTERIVDRLVVEHAAVEPLLRDRAPVRRRASPADPGQG
jgi:transposase